MGKQIKVIKCPSCGNNKPISLGNDRFRCDKCGTEFFLDNDDININVNHNHNPRPNNYNPPNNYNRSSGNKTIVWIFGTLGVLFFLYILILLVGGLFRSKKYNGVSTYSTSSTKTKSPKRKISSSAVAWQLISHDNDVYSICLDYQFNGEKGLHFVIYDFKNDSIIKAINRGTSQVLTTYHRSFYSTGNDYYVFNHNEIWEVDRKNMIISSITDTIAQAKPALNSGFKSIRFLEEYQGDGFVLETNLGKTFYYFPKVDQLYTYKAFNHFASSGMETVAEDAQMRSFYMFENKSSQESSNVAQLMKIDYQYNNGGPENKFRSMDSYTIKNKSAYRVTSLAPIGDEKIAFSPKVIYSDNAYIAISYYPTLASDAPLTIELLGNKGESIWKINIGRDNSVLDVVRIGETIYLLNKRSTLYELSKNTNKVIILS